MSAKTISPEIRVIFLYVRAGAMIFPVLVTYLFCHIFLMPKLREIWAEADIEAANALALLNFVDSLFYWIVPILLGTTALVTLLELTVGAWRRFRTLWLDAIVLLINFLAFIGVLAIATCALLAAGRGIDLPEPRAASL